MLQQDAKYPNPERRRNRAFGPYRRLCLSRLQSNNMASIVRLSSSSFAINLAYSFTICKSLGCYHPWTDEQPVCSYKIMNNNKKKVRNFVYLSTVNLSKEVEIQINSSYQKGKPCKIKFHSVN